MIRAIAIGIVTGFGLLALIYVGSYLLVYVPAARTDGYRLFSRRRWAAFRSGFAACIGGPMDGEGLPVSRRELLGIGLSEWPDVLYERRTRRRFMTIDRKARESDDVVWLGWYERGHMADCYRWMPTGLERFEIEPWEAA